MSTIETLRQYARVCPTNPEARCTTPEDVTCKEIDCRVIKRKSLTTHCEYFEALREQREMKARVEKERHAKDNR